MQKMFRVENVGLMICLLMFSGIGTAEEGPCDRSCLKRFPDQVLMSMINHDPSVLPLSPSYAATENSQPAVPGMMSLWRTVTGVTQMGQIVIDTQAGQVFFTAGVDENGMPAILLARLKIEEYAISELEFYINRSRADSGFLFQPEGLSQPLDAWTSSVPEGKGATREELFHVGRAVFDTSLSVPEACPDCVLMEMGGVVYEDPDYLPAVMAYDPDEETADTGKLITIPCGLIPNRPADPDARVAVVDEEQGIVVSFAVVHGFESPYLVTNATESCFVPATMIEDHRKYLQALGPEQLKNRKILREMPASMAVVEVIRFHSGQIQGMHRYMNLQGPGAGSPWEATVQ